MTFFDQAGTDPFQADVLRETAAMFGVPHEHAVALFLREKRRLAVGARITQYLDILALRHTRELLHAQTRIFEDVGPGAARSRLREGADAAKFVKGPSWLERSRERGVVRESVNA